MKLKNKISLTTRGVLLSTLFALTPIAAHAVNNTNNVGSNVDNSSTAVDYIDTVVAPNVVIENEFEQTKDITGILDLNEVKNSLSRNHPNLPEIKSISSTELPGIFEIVVNKSDIFYADMSGKFLIFGEIISVENNNQVNLTQNRVEELSSFDLKILNYDNAIVRKVGTGEAKIVTFEDPNCGFCRRLYPELNKLNDVTIYTFMIPILGQESVHVSKNIWCSNDREKAWSDYMTDKKLETIDEKLLSLCNVNALEENISFAQEYNIMGTPAIFFENGKSFKGYTEAENIVNRMNEK